jgi:hypothetical protein
LFSDVEHTWTIGVSVGSNIRFVTHVGNVDGDAASPLLGSLKEDDWLNFCQFNNKELIDDKVKTTDSIFLKKIETNVIMRNCMSISLSPQL